MWVGLVNPLPVDSFITEVLVPGSVLDDKDERLSGLRCRLSSRSSWSGGETDINQANKCKWRSSAQFMTGVGCNPTGNQKGFFGGRET